MNILFNKGTHKILAIMTGVGGESSLQLIELAGRTAYQTRDKITEDSAIKFVKRLIENGHESVLEHSSLTVQFDNCSIGMCRELCRHRLLSITEQSTRYVSNEEFNMVMPPRQSPFQTVSYTQDRNTTVEGAVEVAQNVYNSLRTQGWPAEDARQFLPLGITSQIVATANLREWRHILKLRCGKGAHWEIRRVMIELLAHLREILPVIFDDIAPHFTKKEAEDWGWNVIETKPLSDWVKIAL